MTERKNLTTLSIKALKPAPAGKRYMVWDALLPSFGVRVTDKGAKTFIVMKRLYGKLVRWPVGTFPALSLEKARELARDYLEDIAKGVDPKEKLNSRHKAEERRRRDTFEAVAEAFIAKHVSTLRSGSEIERAIKREFVSRWGKQPVTSVSRRDILDLLDEFVSAGKRHQAHHLLAYLRKMYNWAIARDAYGIESSPCDRIKPRDLIGTLEARTHILSDDEIRLIWKATDQLGHPFGMFVKILFLTGQRLREVAGMRWSEINLAKRLWTIPAERMKAEANHIVPLVPEVVAILENLPRKNRGDYVLSTSGGEKAISGFSKAKSTLDGYVAALAEASQKASRQAQIKVSPWRYHDIRRTMRTHLSALPVQDIVRELVISHTQQGLHKVYDQYAYADEKREAMQLWTKRLLEIVKAR